MIKTELWISSVLFYKILFKAFYFAYKMSAAFCHKAYCHWLEVRLEMTKKCICLVGEFSAVIDICESTCYFVPLHLAHSREGMVVSRVGVVVNVKRLYSVASHCAYPVLRLYSYKRAVSKVETADDVFTVKSIDISYKLDRKSVV